MQDGLDDLLLRAERAAGQKLIVRGPATHKGRVGDSVERLLLGQRVVGKQSDHPAAELKSVPVTGERVVERVKLGVISPRSNPLEKCEQVLFVFVEQRGRDYFVRGHHLERFSAARFAELWHAGYLIETAAGRIPGQARGLYLTPHFFADHRLWPRCRP